MTEKQLDELNTVRFKLEQLRQLKEHLSGEIARTFHSYQKINLSEPEEVTLFFSLNYSFRVPKKYIKILFPDMKQIDKDIKNLESEIANF